MVAPAKNVDVICFQLRTTYYSQLNNSLKKDLHSFSNGVKTLITSGKNIQANLPLALEQVFNFRVKAIKWLLSDGEDYLLNKLEEVAPQIEELKSDPKLAVLSDNILFALRCNQKVVKILIDRAKDNEGGAESFLQIPDINYKQFIASIEFGIPDNETAKKFIDWINASLCIEFVTVAADIIYSEKLEVPDKTINELSFLISDAAQEYSAIAVELGIISSRSSNHSPSTHIFDKESIKDEKFLADLGLDDLGDNID